MFIEDTSYLMYFEVYTVLLGRSRMMRRLDQSGVVFKRCDFHAALGPCNHQDPPHFAQVGDAHIRSFLYIAQRESSGEAAVADQKIGSRSL